MESNTAIDAFAALAQDTRLAAFRLLVTTGPEGLTAGEIALRLSVAPSTLSSHLAQMHRAGLLSRRREERNIFYAADYAGIRALFAFLMQDCCGGDRRFLPDGVTCVSPVPARRLEKEIPA